MLPSQPLPHSNIKRLGTDLETGGLEVVLPEDVDAPLDAEVVQQVGDLQLEEILDREQVEHAAVDARLEEGVLVLRQAHVVQPAHHPLVVQAPRLVLERGAGCGRPERKTVSLLGSGKAKKIA